MRLYEGVIDRYSDRTFGIGTNAGGGIYAWIVLETEDEVKMFQDELERQGYRPDVIRPGIALKIVRTETRYPDGSTPITGPVTTAWERFVKYIHDRYGMEWWKWCRQENEKIIAREKAEFEFARKLGFRHKKALMDASEAIRNDGDVTWYVTDMPDGRFAIWNTAKLSVDHVEYFSTREEAVRSLSKSK